MKINLSLRVFQIGSLFAGFASVFLNSQLIKAQIIPDRTLPINSNITTNSNVIEITGGTPVGRNLFHSFNKFSVLEGQTAFFNNAQSIQTIFSRVTGGSPSYINGLIQANGTANLFFLNSNGIIFGPNAALNIGGSFLATTANSINFADGAKFGATSGSSDVTISVPIGLDFRNAGPIEINNQGHDLVIGSFPTFGFPTSGLQSNGKTLAIVGGNVTLNGGIISALDGRIELGAVRSGLVKLNLSDFLSLDYETATAFKDIQLSNQSLLNVYGTNPGSLKIYADSVIFRDGSLASLQNLGPNSNSQLNIHAASSVLFDGVSRIGNRRGSFSGLNTEALGSGSGANIEVVTPIFTVTGGAGISTASFGVGQGGDINVSVERLAVRDGSGIAASAFGPSDSGSLKLQATNSIEISGYSLDPATASVVLPGYTDFPTTVGTFAFAQKAGNVEIDSPLLQISSGATIGTAAFGTGKGGDVNVNSNLVEIGGVTPSLSGSTINSSTYGSGEAGSISISASELNLIEGGAISTSTYSSGDAGKIAINADSVEVRGFTSSVNSRIDSSASILPPEFQEVFGTPDQPSGRSGDITINTGRLAVSERGTISVSNEGIGNGGNIGLIAPTIVLERDGSIAATTQSGEGGNIDIASQDLRLFDSQISASAGGAGNGGNITIDTISFIALNNSRIAANAFAGKGGNVGIEVDGFFLSSDSRITASSELGVSGSVTINNTPFQINSQRIPSPQLSLEQLAQQSCIAYKSRTYKVSIGGQGGAQAGENSPRGYTFEDLIPLRQVIAAERTEDGNIQLLNCDQYWEKLQREGKAPNTDN